MKTNIIYNKSCLSMPEIDNNSIDCVITSPPYWGLRDYGVADQIGLEPTLQEYLDKMFIVTAECKRVLKPTGVMWWNHGDCYSSRTKGDNRTAQEMGRKQTLTGGQGFRVAHAIGTRKIDSGSKTKCLALQNYRLILRLIDEQGWILRNTVIWSKPNGMPSSSKDRLANKYEPVFMLVKNKKYWFDLDAIREKYKQEWGPRNRENMKLRKIANYGKTALQNKEQNLFGKNPGDVWSIPTQPYPEVHFATFPEKLIIKPILSSCPEGGIVLDPFAGSGTTLAMAKRYNRQYIGYEINPKYLKFINKRLEAEKTLWD